MKADESGLEITQQQGPWVIRLWWPGGQVVGGPQRVTIEKTDEATEQDVALGISTTVLRRLDLPGAVEMARTMAPQAQEVLTGLTERIDASGEAAALLLANEGVSERYLVMLASLYKHMADTGAPAPIPWLARLIDRRPETVKDHLKKARREGYLSTVTGRAGGQLTDKAMAVLESMAQAPE
ncbi:hypothetical protein [Kitasatospora sp. NPDC094011]|uniref:hypothetical protein n=1 Tax=Kitasatospora sp. NPDC094011 TaxID=3364090 RepID=UPI0038258471